MNNDIEALKATADRNARTAEAWGKVARHLADLVVDVDELGTEELEVFGEALRNATKSEDHFAGWAIHWNTKLAAAEAAAEGGA